MSEHDKVPETLEEAQTLLKAEREAKEKALERAIGAEKVIESHKKNDKKDPDPKPNDPVSQTPEERQAELNKVLDERDFYGKNPDMVEYKGKLSELTAGGQFTLNEAKAVLESRDPTIANRKNANNIDFTTGKSGVNAKTMTQEQFSKLSGAEFARANEMIKSGEVKII